MSCYAWGVWKIFKWVLIVFSICAVLLVGSVWILVWREQTRFWNELVSSRSVDFVPYDSIPLVVRRAVLAAEGKDFFGCDGWSEYRMLANLISNLPRFEHPKLNCTIAVMVAREVILRRGIHGHILWQFHVMWDVSELYSRLSNQEILAEYMNRAYVGNEAYGIKNAANFYFHKSLDTLTEEQAAGLAGLLKSPSYYDPIKHPDRFNERQKKVLAEMNSP